MKKKSNRLNDIIGFIERIVINIGEYVESKLKSKRDDDEIGIVKYHKEGDKWYDEYGNEINPTWEKSE